MSSKRAQEEKQIYNVIKSSFEAILDPANLSANLVGYNISKEVFIKGFRYTNRDIKMRTPAIVQLCKFAKTRFGSMYSGNIDLSCPIAFFCSGVQNIGENISQIAYTGVAFAIWVLDVLAEADKIDELNDILPEDLNYAGAKIFDINHGNDLIERIASVCDNAETDEGSAKILNQLISLLPNEYVEKAIDDYDKLAWQLLEISLKEYYGLELEKESFLREIDVAIGFESLSHMSPSLVEDKLRGNIAIAAKADLIDFTIITMFSVFQNYYNAELKTENAIKVFNRINEIIIDNPYEICGIYYVLKQRNDFRYWAMGPFATAVTFAAKRLPWMCDLEYEEQNGGTAFNDSDNYSLKYKSSMFDTSKTKSGLLNTSQLVYHLSGGGILPRRFNSYKSERMILERNGVSQSAINFITTASSMLAELDKRNEYYGCTPILDDATEDKSEEAPDVSTFDANKITSLIRETKDAIRKARSENHNIEEQRRKLQKEYDELNRLYQQEHREIVDLRNYIFNQESDEQTETQDVDLKIEYPYTTKHNVIVFGGHETWSKAIKLLFVNVRFINKDTLPNQDMIKNADIVWIQPNSIGHSKYYKILDVVRTYHIPLRYLAFSSAEKCAEQIVLEDMK